VARPFLNNYMVKREVGRFYIGRARTAAAARVNCISELSSSRFLDCNTTTELLQLHNHLNKCCNYE
jgi:hypothetical protein